MVVRVLELLTHIHNDNIEQDSSPLAEYSCIGYFDALNIERFEYDVNSKVLNIYEMVEKELLKNLDGRCTRKALICVSKDLQKEDEFWQEAENHNLLFISVIRLNDSEKGNTAKIIEEFNRRPLSMAYLTYDASEVVLLTSTDSCQEGMESVVSLHTEISVYRVFSVMAIKENITLKEGIDEQIQCRLHASVRDMKEVNVWVDRLETTLSHNCECFHTLGEKDLLIEIKDITMNQILPLYLGEQLLSHGNITFQKAFFEMQSEFLTVAKR